MAGQHSHFWNYADGEHEYAATRYANEYNRCIGVLERRLEGRDWLAGRLFHRRHGKLAVGPNRQGNGPAARQFPNVSRWRSAIKERPAVQKGVDLGKDLRRTAPPSDEERKLLYQQTAQSTSALAKKASGKD